MISIIIPTYNEKENSIPLISAIGNACTTNKIDYEIIIIDDNSPDGTGQYIQKKFAEDIRVRCLIRNTERGLGTAILYGITQARGDIIVGMDADFNHPPESIPTLVRALQEQKGDMIVGSRFVKGGGMHGAIRSFGSRVVNAILRIVFGFPIHDNLSGYYAIYKSTLNKMNLKNIYSGYGEYHMRLVWYISRVHKLHIHENPVFFGKRLYGSSKSDLLNMLLSYFAEAWALTRLQTYRDQ